MRPVNNFLGQVIGNASEGKYNTVNNSSSGKVTFQKCLNSGITPFSSKNSNKSQTFATGAYQRLHEARPRRVVWLWEPEYSFVRSSIHPSVRPCLRPHACLHIRPSYLFIRSFFNSLVILFSTFFIAHLLFNSLSRGSLIR